MRGPRGTGPGLLGAVVVEQGVNEGEELAYDGDEGHLLLLVAVAEALVEGLGPGIAALGGGAGRTVH